MDSKRGLRYFIIVFAFVILGFNFVSAASCSITNSCASDNTVMKLSSSTNAHGELWLELNYNRYLCCDFTGEHSCTGDNEVLRLSAVTNAHAEIPYLNNYPLGSRVCFGNLSCMKASPCPSGYFQMVSLSADTNAQLAQFSTYPTKICCTFTIPAALCGNGVVDSGDGESCDGSNLNGASCLSLGYDAGVLACFPPGNPSECKFNATNCTDCGDGVREGLEQCDDGNNVNGDCCSSTCTFEANGAACTNDGNACTNDFCLSPNNGTCMHTPKNCGDANVCTADSCNVLTGCVNTPIPCAPRECNTVVCNSLTGCQYTPVASGTSCSDEGNPCTLDMCNAGGVCSHIVISGCCLNNAQCGGSAFCPADYCNLTDHECYENYPACNNGDGCCPSGCNIGNDNDCTVCTLDSQCTNSPGPCNPGDCVGGACTYPSITSCTDGDGCCPGSINGCYATNDDECSAVCGNGVRENPPEQCDGAQLGGATCASVFGAGYTGALTCYPAGGSNQCRYNPALCVPPCVIDSAQWNPIGTVLNGTPVELIVNGTNCSGKLIRYNIFEKDIAVNDPITGGNPPGTNPSTTLFPPGNTLKINWNAWYIDDTGAFQTPPPEYFFNATVVAGASSRQSPNSGGVSDPNLLSVTLPPPNCPNGIINSGEDCDCGLDAICTPSELDNKNCEDVLGVGAGGTISCSQATCTFTGCTPACDLTQATWSVTEATQGSTVRLNVQGTNCDGKRITFIVREQDAGGDDNVINNPVDIIYSSSSNYGTWVAEWPDTEGETTPEYYFIATVSGTTENINSNLLEVTEEAAECSLITQCSNYNKQADCEADICIVGAKSVPDDVRCGHVWDAAKQCSYDTTCGCYWNTTLPSNNCQAKWDTKEKCITVPLCGNGQLDEGEECDGALLRVKDNSCLPFDDYTSGTISCYPVGSPYECSYNFANCVKSGGYCGNGVVEVERGETCELPNTNGCDANCHVLTPPEIRCGDGKLDEVYEQCDGNLFRLEDPRCDWFDEYTSGMLGCNIPGSEYECTYNYSKCIKSGVYCPNGVVDTSRGEECEPPNAGNCDALCHWKTDPPVVEIKIGECLYNQENEDNCDDGKLERILSANWVWDSTNVGRATPAIGYVRDLRDGLWYYDPENQMAKCAPRTDVISCPAAIQVPFFGIYQGVIALVIVGLIYILYSLKDKKRKNK